MPGHEPYEKDGAARPVDDQIIVGFERRRPSLALENRRGA